MLLSKELKALSAPLLLDKDVQNLFRSFRQVLVEVLLQQGLQTREPHRLDGPGHFSSLDGALLLSWNEALDPHTGYTYLLGLELQLELSGDHAGRCRLQVKQSCPDVPSADIEHTAFASTAPVGEPTDTQLPKLRKQLMQDCDSAWLAKERSRLDNWLSELLTP